MTHPALWTNGGIFRHVLISAERSFVMKDGRGEGGQDLSDRQCVHIQIPEERVDLTGSEKGRR